MRWEIILKILISAKELSEINFERLKNALVYIKHNLINSDSNMYLTADSLIDKNNMITGSNNIILRKFMWNRGGKVKCIWMKV